MLPNRNKSQNLSLIVNHCHKNPRKKKETKRHRSIIAHNKRKSVYYLKVFVVSYIIHQAGPKEGSKIRMDQ